MRRTCSRFPTSPSPFHISRKDDARPAPEPVARVHRVLRRPCYAVRAAASVKCVISRASALKAQAIPFSAIASSTIRAPTQ
jgi:hypothetical protein